MHPEGEFMCPFTIETLATLEESRVEVANSSILVTEECVDTNGLAKSTEFVSKCCGLAVEVGLGGI